MKPPLRSRRCRPLKGEQAAGNLLYMPGKVRETLAAPFGATERET
ncbi:MAG TPA: hypothetical protein PKL28_05075 [Rhodocyclaceae bacterium]|nr:hypothetical protein [Rhodocyclaceae bacterium]HNM21930.1 hypothetical protein [Rhodocyclaceae bacterium]HNM80402.1 hypothetical protein [Rhodocyclaceae bacterium]HNP03929.1 hypothetical protein [Rhodocyclaceae bacterium]